MALKQVTPEAVARELILIYGSPGSGKTRLATSLPERFGKIAYFAMDDGSEALSSVLSQYRDRITVFRPEWGDPMVEAVELTHTDWKAKGFTTLIVDTFTAYTQKTLDHIVHKGLAQANHRGMGNPGTPAYTALPDMADYGMTQAVIRNFIANLFNHQRDLNILLICHQTLDRNEKDDKASLGGPATVGRAMVEWLPSRFSSVIRMDRIARQVAKGGKVETETKLIARMAQHGVWIARRNEAGKDGNPLPSLELDVDPKNFWVEYDKNRPTVKETP